MTRPELGIITEVNQAFADLDLSPIPITLGRELSKHTVTLVEEYPSPGNKELDDSGIPYALSYPGARPETSFTLVSDQVDACQVSSENDLGFYINTMASDGSELVFYLNDLLRSKEASPIEDRVPVVAFGSNANPGQLKSKFKKLDGADRNIVPTLKANIKGVVPVYAARIGINGYVFTDLFPVGDDVESQVHINFLSLPQLKAMDATEKAYSLCKIPNVRLQTKEPDGYNTDAYLYVGREDTGGANILVDEFGKPIRLAEIDTEGEGLDKKFAVMSQAEVQRYIYETAAEEIERNLMLDRRPEDEVDLIKLIINRQKDSRLSWLRDYRRRYFPDQPLGRIVGMQIQRAITSSGITIPASGIRRVIEKNSQDIALDDVQDFGKLNGLKT